ncbi:MAG: dethiobiotin synthase [Buchnera aphidicola (Pentalonia nigronervosa)]|uniref:ATP-dependent dethiobiotin synthetase BioD n=1 Tax=Buchnera aphidicola (Pentalonia nigronervosa) TaxID=1309793 RepID=A0A7H1AZS6_9GAMM|nr:MAG: dethiobiotin synthase [Buchnera aphidicola (Pentalonia nigronervosa)]
MIKKFFVTGTDTDVGKTIVSGILLKKATQYGYKTGGYKPISSGHYSYKNYSYNKDAVLLKKNSSIKLSIGEVNPITFFEYAPPHVLSSLQGLIIQKQHLSLGLKKIAKKCNWIIIEGVGGWYTPFSYKNTFSDWVKEEKLTVIIIVGIKLGCINHAILTEKAILSENLICGGWIANNIFLEDEYNLYYIQTLLNYIQSPLLGVIPYFKHVDKINTRNIKIQLPQ